MFCVAVNSLKSTVTRESNQNSSPAVPHYDICAAPTDVRSQGAQGEEGVYATIANGENIYHTVVDPTTIYADPTSPSYVVRSTVLFTYVITHLLLLLLQSEVYSTGSIFDTAGTYVATLVSHTYNNALFVCPSTATSVHDLMPYVTMLCVGGEICV